MPPQASKPRPSSSAYRVGSDLLTMHGGEAEFIAALHADAALEEGDLDKQARWLAVLRAIADTKRAERLTGELDH